MWMLNNQTPYAAERNWVLDKNAAKGWVVAVKATLDILPDGTTKLADKQEEPLYGEEYSGEPGKSSILYDGDLTGPKKNTDVILNGHAYAPGGNPVTEIIVTMKVHKITKQLRVHGDRRWERGVLGLSMSPPEPFDKMPLDLRAGVWRLGHQAGESRRSAPRAAQHDRRRVRHPRRASRGPAPAQRRRPQTPHLLLEGPPAARRVRGGGQLLDAPSEIRRNVRRQVAERAIPPASQRFRRTLLPVGTRGPAGAGLPARW